MIQFRKVLQFRGKATSANAVMQRSQTKFMLGMSAILSDLTSLFDFEAYEIHFWTQKIVKCVNE